MSGFQSSRGGAPFPRTVTEWVDKGMEPAAAEHKVRQDVFGHDYQTDAKGEPIERGKGSAAQPTAQHQQAKQIADEAEARRQMTMGWHPGLAQAFDPRTAPAPRRRGPARRKKATTPQTAAGADA